MIIDRNERKRFTDDATRKQKNQRIEKHMTEAKQSSWADAWFEVAFYAVVMNAGPIIAVIVANEGAKQLLASYVQVSKSLPAQLQDAQAAFNGMSSFGTLLPLGIVSGISGVLGLLIQTLLIHFAAKMLGGVGTWRHLIQVLLSFYNRWMWRLFAILCAAIYIGFISVFSPVALCPMIILVVLALYVSGQTSSKVGQAYDFGGAKGCLTVIASSLIIFVINAVIYYAMVQSLSAAFSQIKPG